MADDRTLAQFFFELGYGACWAEAAIRNGEKPPFDLTDAVIERAWAITPETYDDHAEFDEKLGLVDAAPELLDALADFCLSAESAAGCIDGASHDENYSEILSFAGSALASSYDKARGILAKVAKP